MCWPTKASSSRSAACSARRLVGLADDDADRLAVGLQWRPQPVAVADDADELDLALRDELARGAPASMIAGAPVRRT